MVSISVNDLLNATSGELVAGKKDDIITAGFSTDSRGILPGQIFIALTGERFDGHAFVIESITKGAKGVIFSNDVNISEIDKEGLVAIKVEDTLIALGDIARYYRDRFSIPVIGITGSNGKTTTKEMLSCILSRYFNLVKSRKSYNNAIGVPLTLLELTEQTQVCIVELGMNHPGEIAYLTNIVRPEIGVITNVSESHIGYLGSKEAIADAKFELLANMCDTGTAVLNVDDTYVAKMVDKYNGRIITFGINNPADVKAVNIKDDGYKIRFSVEYDKNKITQEICMPVLGKYNVYNALAACCVVLVLGLNLEDAVYALNEYRAQPLRMEVIEKDGVKIINDTYNANPASVKMALTTLQKLPCTAGCKIVVLGDMLELGKWSDILHQDIGKFITDIDDDIDMLITVGESAALIAEIVESKSKINVITCDNNQEVIAQLKNTIKPNDIVLVKGSRKMRLDEVVDGILS